jgi:hypothetical protein
MDVYLKNIRSYVPFFLLDHVGLIRLLYLMFCVFMLKIQSNNNSQKTNNKQITMTKIQNSKQLAFDLI